MYHVGLCFWANKWWLWWSWSWICAYGL